VEDGCVAPAWATHQAAYKQLQTYKKQIPSLSTCNEVLIASGVPEAWIGSLTAGQEWLEPWRAIESEDDSASSFA
jgi:type I restriction enzyme R subunit